MFKSIRKASLVTALLTTTPFTALAEELEKSPIPPKIEAGMSAEMKHQAGIGSNYAYSAAGVVEVGGAINYSSSKSRTSAGFTPSVGYFFIDNFQISALTNFTYTHLKEDNTTNEGYTETEDTTNSGSIVLEPSIHMSLSRQDFIFGGLGLGAYFAKDQDTGFAVAPRVGFKTLVGRSGMLSVALQGVYALNVQDEEDIDGTVITVEDGVNLSFGYSVLL